MVYRTPVIYPQSHNTMKNEEPSVKHNNLAEHIDRLNIPNDGFCMEQRSESKTMSDHNDDENGG